MPTDVPQNEDSKNKEKVQKHQILETLGQSYISGSVPKGPEIDKYTDLKHTNHSDSTIPDSFEHKITETKFESSGVMCKELVSREPMPTFVPQHEDLKKKKMFKIIRCWKHLSKSVSKLMEKMLSLHLMFIVLNL